MAAAPNAEVRIEVIPISAILDVALNAAVPSVVAQTASGDFPNVVVQIVVQVVARAVVIQCVPDVETPFVPAAATRCSQSAVYQCVADLDAMVVLQNEALKALPYGAQDVVPVPVLAQFAPDVVQSVADVAQVPDVSLFSAPAQPQVVQ